MTRTIPWIAERELAAALRARWFWTYSAIFLAAGVVLVTFAPADALVYGYRGFAKALVGMVHLALLFVPLMALLPAAASVAEERESGVLEYLLAQPVDRSEVYQGKWLGLAVALLSSLTLGFSVAAGAALWRGVPWSLPLVLHVFVALLALVFLSLGLWFSAISASRARATTWGILVWLAFAALGTLGFMLAFVRLGVPRGVLMGWALLNPVEAFRLGVVAAVDPDLTMLGPVGTALAGRLGGWGAGIAAALSLVGWTAAAWWMGRVGFSRNRL